MQSQNGHISLSPSDVTAYLGCRHLTTLSLQVAKKKLAKPEVKNEQAELVFRKGLEHEDAYLRSLVGKGLSVRTIELEPDRDWERAARETVAAMKEGVDVVYQGVLASDGWRGQADFLMRVETPSALGAWSYEALDTKLARHAKPTYILQLCFYSEQLGRVTGRAPRQIHVVLGSGEGVSLSLSYLVQTEPRGLPHAVRSARSWLAGADVVFAMPDTIVLPLDALRQVHAQRLASGADLTLGLFPVDEPERFGPVEVAADGRTIVRILDKPGHREVKTVWGVCAWSPAFTDFCAEWDAAAERERPAERVLSNAFEGARAAGLKVDACVLEGGVYLDIGTPHGLRAALRLLVEHGVLEQVQAALGAAE